jgi:drug/metabolite transporter (DMT)-like permease
MNVTGLAHLAIVYVLWGSTFLAIRVAVREGSGFPPFTMAGTRVLTAGLLILLIARLRGKRVRASRSELLILGISGVLLWTGGNGLVTWAEQRADSGFAALVIATVPIWVALMESYLDRRAPSLLLVASLVTALLGVGVLSAPVFTSGVRADILSLLALGLGSLTWSAGTVLQSRRRVQLGHHASSGYQHLAGAFGFVVMSRLAAESIPSPVPEAWYAWGYLIVFGSIIGYTSYIQTLRLLPLSVATTNAFVNPVIAFILGAIVLGEEVAPTTLAGAALVMVGVAGVFRERIRLRRRALASGNGE